MEILMANPRGFCAGVDRAITIVERALELFGAPIYVRHEVVHNRPVVESLKLRGAIFTDDVDDIPVGSTVIFSAHGVSQAVREQAAERQLKVFDATCPLVTKVHMQVERFSRQGIECVFIGHAGHPEVEGTMGQYGDQNLIHLVENIEHARSVQLAREEHCAYVTQTTLSVDETQAMIAVLRERFPKIQGPRKEDICYATQNRQDAVKDLLKRVDVLLVVGSPESSNSNRLCELAHLTGRPGYLVDSPSLLRREWFQDCRVVGLTAGASAPENQVQQIINRLVDWGAEPPVEQPGKEEFISFSLPGALRRSVARGETAGVS
jgi:4-hydroxy-3-methylbut-2-en-1-yl diphosphate reductase